MTRPILTAAALVVTLGRSAIAQFRQATSNEIAPFWR
jgi:hypothetical protein